MSRVMKSMKEYAAYTLLSISILFFRSTLEAQPGIEAAVLPWPSASKAAVSITFDDAYISHVSRAMPLLENHGFRGTFFLIVDKLFRRGKFINVRPSAPISEWQAAAARGHEMASHTVSHVPLDAIEVQQMRAELIHSKAILDSLFLGEPVVSLAYPFSRTNAAVAEEARLIYQSGRVGPPTDGNAVYNDPATVDLMSLKAFFPCSTVAQWHSAVERTIAGNGWLVEALHPIDEPGFCRVATEDFADHLHYLSQQHPALWVAPVRDVVKRIRQWRTVELQIESISKKVYQLRIIGAHSYQPGWQVALYLNDPHLWGVEEENGWIVSSTIEEDALVFSWPQQRTNDLLFLRPKDQTHIAQYSWGDLKHAIRKRPEH
ncbi:MAG: polysaccharide deacetylase family protein [Gemmatimonadetes bacterium]|nr:polysaccharide deacetylase family protein [Gemmatimonadota bacterium]MYB68529.1 polysaccharide deacetylase family protein [Gemmatimonadota bacterium]